MKSINFIKLLSVLLCIVMLLAACSPKKTETETTADTTTESISETETKSETETVTEEETEEPTMAPVDPVLENFLGFEYNNGLKDIDPATLERIDGEVIAASSDDGIIVIKTTDVDLKNIVTDKYTVYNVNLGKQVLEISNNYKFGYYDDVNWNDFAVKETVYQEVAPDTFIVSTVTSVADYPERAMKISVVEIGSLCYVEVATAEFTKIEDAVRAENPEGCYYTVALKYEYYDVAGALIKTSAAPCTADGYENVYYFGTTCAVFDADTNQLVCVTDSETQTIVGAYDFENDKYGYISGSREGVFGSDEEYVDVFDKATGARKLRYYFDASASGSSWFVLNNGNIVIQNSYALPEESASKGDIIVGANLSYRIETEILNVKTGDVEKAEFNYMIANLFDKNDLNEMYGLEENGVSLTDNVVNAVFAVEYEEVFRMNMTSIKLVVVDNKLNVLFELDRIIPEHKITMVGDLGIKTLATGDYLLTLDNVVTSRAIVTKDGTVRAYLSDDMKIMGKYVVSDTGIFDFDLNLLYNFAENEYTYVQILGDKGVIVSKSQIWTTWDDFSGANIERTYRDYYVVTESGDAAAPFKVTQLDFNDASDGTALNTSYDPTYDYYLSSFSNCDENGYEKVTFASVGDDYFVTYNASIDKYTVWTANFKHVLTADAAITVLDFGDRYLLKTGITEPDATVKNILYVLGEAAETVVD